MAARRGRARGWSARSARHFFDGRQQLLQCKLAGVRRSDESENSGLTNNCAVQPDGSFSYAGVSAARLQSAPAFAGILALVEQSTGGRLGQAATQLYNLYNGSHAAAIFHDVTQGNNSVSCTQGKQIAPRTPRDITSRAATTRRLATIWLPGWEASTQCN